MSPSFPVAAKEEDPDEKVDTADTETDPAHRESNNGGRQDKEESSVESKEKDLSDLKNQKRNDDDNNDKDVLEEHSQKLQFCVNKKDNNGVGEEEEQEWSVWSLEFEVSDMRLKRLKEQSAPIDI